MADNQYPLEKRIAIILDFDLTLTEEYMEEPLIAHYMDNVKRAYHGLRDKNGDVITFDSPSDYFRIVDRWGEPNNGVAYVSQMLHDIRAGVFPNVTNDDLRHFGQYIRMAPGVPEFFEKLKQEFEGDCELKYYIVSVGLKEMILGNPVAKYVDGVYGTEMVSLANMYDPSKPAVLDSVARIMTPFSKSHSAIEVAKGGKENVNRVMGHNEYTLDYRNIITIGDGLTDVSQFAYLNKKGSKNICVYKMGDNNAFEKINNNKIVRERVSALLGRDYREGSMLWTYLKRSVNQILSRGCDFDPLLLDMYRKKKIRDARIKKIIDEHTEKCTECRGLYGFEWEPPRSSLQE
ncbi:MAG: hypothetical protein AABY09_03960 [Nanoarchaeota archaeon]